MAGDAVFAREAGDEMEFCGGGGGREKLQEDLEGVGAVAAAADGEVGGA